MIKIGDFVNKSGYKFKVLGIKGNTLDLRGMEGQGETIGELEFVSLWNEPAKIKRRR